MATYPRMVRSRNIRSTTVVQENGTLTSRARTTGAHSHINADDARDPERLVKTINQLQDDIAAATQAQRSNPLATPFIKRGLSLAHGATLAIPHTLKRKYTDVHFTNPMNVGSLNVLSDAATLAKYPASQFVVVHNGAASGTASFGIVVAGD